MTEDQPRLLNVTEAARRLGIHPHTLRSWADKGLVPVVRTLTGYRRFDPGDIDRVIAEMRSGKLAA
jgi:excisionase family DNA binding protein